MPLTLTRTPRPHDQERPPPPSEAPPEDVGGGIGDVGAIDEGAADTGAEAGQDAEINTGNPGAREWVAPPPLAPLGTHELARKLAVEWKFRSLSRLLVARCFAVRGQPYRQSAPPSACHRPRWNLRSPRRCFCTFSPSASRGSRVAAQGLRQFCATERLWALNQSQCSAMESERQARKAT